MTIASSIFVMIAGAAGFVLGFVQQGLAGRSRRQVTIEDRREPPAR